MNDLNTILIEGNLTHDTMMTILPSGGQVVCRFPIASNKSYYNREKGIFEQDTSYFTIEAWGSLARYCSVYLAKGRGVRIIGQLKQTKWEGQDGIKHERVYIVAEHVEYQTKHGKNENDTHILRGEEPMEQGIDTSQAKDHLDAAVTMEDSLPEAEPEAEPSDI